MWQPQCRQDWGQLENIFKKVNLSEMFLGSVPEVLEELVNKLLTFYINELSVRLNKGFPSISGWNMKYVIFKTRVHFLWAASVPLIPHREVWPNYKIGIFSTMTIVIIYGVCASIQGTRSSVMRRAHMRGVTWTSYYSTGNVKRTSCLPTELNIMSEFKM